MGDVKPAWMHPGFRYPPSSPEAVALREAIKPGPDYVPNMKVRIAELEAENARLNAALQYEQHRASRIGTHSDDCWSWGPQHYDCATRRMAELEAALAAAQNADAEANGHLRAKLATAVGALERINAGAVDGLDLARDSVVLGRAIKVANQALAKITEQTK